MKNLIKTGWHIIVAVLDFICFKILHLPLSDGQWNGFLQFVRFGIVGVSNTVVSYSIYVIFLLLFQKQGWFARTDYVIAHIIAFLISVLWSFYWNRKFVFHADQADIPWPQALLKTYMTYAFTGLFLNSVLSVFWVELVHVPKIVVPLINLFINVPLNFLLNKFWAFRKKK